MKEMRSTFNVLVYTEYIMSLIEIHKGRVYLSGKLGSEGKKVFA
jgi:hypothetical protein